MMSIRLFLLSFLLIASITIYAQELSLKSGAFGYTHMIDGVLVGQSDFKEAMRSNPGAFAVYKSNAYAKTMAMMFALVGGGLAGYQMGHILRFNQEYPKPKWNLAIYGGALIAIGIVADSSYRSSTKRAIAIYNRGLTYTEDPPKVIVGMEIGEHGVGLQVRF